MKILEYSSYEEYIATQKRVTATKFKRVSCTKEETQILARYVKKHLPKAKFGLCHGVRNGWEVRRLQGLLPGVRILGTDISPIVTEKDVADVIQWDFHKAKSEWIGAVDFIYSNALDHSIKPSACVKQWIRCLRPGGLCFVAWCGGKRVKFVSTSDPFGATLKEYVEMVKKLCRVIKVLKVNYNKEVISASSTLNLIVGTPRS